MGKVLPELPQSDKFGRNEILAYLQAHGPSTIAQILGTNDYNANNNLQAVLTANPDLFRRAGKFRTGKGGTQPALWALVEGARVIERRGGPREKDMR